MIYPKENVEREGVYKAYFEKFGNDPITYGLYWNDLETYESLLAAAIKDNVEYFEEEPEKGDVY
jgi:hypothetical protein